MRIIREQWGEGRAIVAIAAVCMFLLQTMAVGVATASLSGADVGLASLVCSSDKTNATSDGDQPAPSHHHGGACCILHDETAVEPDSSPAAALIVALTPPTIVGAPTNPFGVIHAAPELSPLSARAPPSKHV